MIIEPASTIDQFTQPDFMATPEKITKESRQCNDPNPSFSIWVTKGPCTGGPCKPLYWVALGGPNSKQWAEKLSSTPVEPQEFWRLMDCFFNNRKYLSVSAWCNKNS